MEEDYLDMELMGMLCNNSKGKINAFLFSHQKNLKNEKAIMYFSLFFLNLLFLFFTLFKKVIASTSLPKEKLKILHQQDD